MKRWYTFILLFSLTLISFDRVIGMDMARSAIQRVTGPVVYGLSVIGFTVSDLTDYLVELPYVHNENVRLSLENDTMRAQLGKLAELEQENQILRRELGVAGVRTSEKILARSVGIQKYGNDIVLVVNKGEEDQIRIGDIAVLDDKLIGRVVEVLPSQAYILPIVSVSSRIPADIRAHGLKTVNALAVGKFNSRLELSEVLQADTIQKGDIVVTSGEGGMFPSGLVLGVVEEVSSTSTDIFKTAFLTTNWKFSELRNVFILHP